MILLQGAAIIVFPEYGLMPSRLARHQAYNFTEPVADPNSGVQQIPCRQRDVAGIEVQRRFSCMAVDNAMYITANIGERAPCDNSLDQRCPTDGRYQFNTNIVFGPDGVLVAKYRKYNLFMSEPSYDQPPTVDYSYFDTPYGRFGAIVCFDIIFRQPSVLLVEKFNVSHVLFPTAWKNQLPYYLSVAFHQAFAIGLGVNLLSANKHYPGAGLCGSGVYGSQQTHSYRYDEISMNSSLILAEIPTKPTKITSGHPLRHSYHDFHNQVEFSGELFGDLFNFVMLKDRSGIVSVCHNSLCCSISYARDSSADRFALGSFRGLHTLEGEYYLEICILLKCRTDDRSQCAGDSKTSNTRFSFFKLSGSFSTKYIYPMVIRHGVPLSTEDWDYTGEYIVSFGSSQPLISSTMYGRRFDLDQTVNDNSSIIKSEL
jgi:pantetheine hydrolase